MCPLLLLGVSCSHSYCICIDPFRPNALIIHYTNNDQIMRDGEMVLIDAGGEYK